MSRSTVYTVPCADCRRPVQMTKYELDDHGHAYCGECLRRAEEAEARRRAATTHRGAA